MTGTRFHSAPATINKSKTHHHNSWELGLYDFSQGVVDRYLDWWGRV